MTRKIVRCESCGQSMPWDEPTPPVCVRDGESHVLHDMWIIVGGRSVQLGDSEITLHYDGVDTLEGVFAGDEGLHERIEVVIGDGDLPHVLAVPPDTGRER